MADKNEYEKLTNRDANWLANYEELKAHVLETGHFCDKHTRLCNKIKYQRKRIKAGTMPEEQRLMFEALEKMRLEAHTGGRKRKES